MIPLFFFTQWKTPFPQAVDLPADERVENDGSPEFTQRCSPLWVLQEHLVTHEVFLTERWQIRHDRVLCASSSCSSLRVDKGDCTQDPTRIECTGFWWVPPAQLLAVNSVQEKPSNIHRYIDTKIANSYIQSIYESSGNSSSRVPEYLSQTFWHVNGRCGSPCSPQQSGLSTYVLFWKPIRAEFPSDLPSA